MQKFLSAFIAGMLLLSFQGPVQAQKEVEPPAIPPMLEDRPPLAQPEAKESKFSDKAQEPKAKISPKTGSKMKSSGRASLKRKNKKTRTVTGKKKFDSTAKKKTGVTAKPKQRKAPSNT